MTTFVDKPTSSRRGASLILSTACLTGFVAVGSFALDAGRVQLSRGELRRAADAAARAGAAGLETTVSQALANARHYAKANTVDLRPLTDDGIEITVGRWDTQRRQFSVQLNGSQSYNAVRVVMSRPSTGPESTPLVWASLLGVKGVAIRAESIAMFIPGENVEHRVDGVANPFLSGMPKGSVASLNNPHNSPDFAGDASSSNADRRKQSPPVVALSVTPGQWLSFDNIEGTVRHDPHLSDYQPDGQLNSVGRNTNGNENGIGDLTAPINSLVGVFLGNDRPDLTGAPKADPVVSSDAGTAAGRDFAQLQPANKQIFFIGDGVNASGTRQRFQVPAGATRLFLATWDFYEWNNNAGYRVVQISRPGTVVMVK